MAGADVIDYSLYLVTGRDLLPPGMDYLESLEQSLQGGVTIVQIREKTTDTAEFIRIAKESKVICDRYNVPLLINDRIDIALAINATGVHLGQTDMPFALAKKLLPTGSIIGISCNNIEHANMAVQDGADYVGIGAVWGTQTKALTSPIIGVRDVGPILEVLDGTQIKAVAIGGIKSHNLLRTLHGSVSRTGHPLDGVAIVSDIVASPEPKLAAERLSSTIRSFKALPSAIGVLAQSPDELHARILEGVARLIEHVRERSPLIHQITNNVVATQSANATLAIGASPIMATAAEEMEALARIPGGLLVNIGTLTGLTGEGMLQAGIHANAQRKPIVFDPVGVGASNFRKETVKNLLNTWQASVIKGNAGELAALSGSTEVLSKGVDSVGSGFKDPPAFVRALANKERCIVILTGPTDYVSDGQTVVALNNGNAMLGRITGSGCLVGTCTATYCAAASALADVKAKNDGGKLVNGDMFLAAITGVLVPTIAAELAVTREDVRGPGTFLPALLDTLGALTPQDIKNLAKISMY